MFKERDSQPATNSVEHPVRDRSEWILRLLWAPDDRDQTNTPIYGKTRLMKLAFLLDQRLGDEFGVETGFKFEPDKYGPFDNGVYDAVKLLKNDGYLLVQQPEEHDGPYDTVMYKLSSEGAEQAAELYANLPADQQELIQWIKNKYGFQKLGRLLTYVYNQYPSMTTESVLK